LHGFSAWWKELVAILLSWGPYGLFLLAALDSAGLPIVGGVDVLLVTLAAHFPDKAYLAALCALAGSVVGSAVLFSIARQGGRVFLSKHINNSRRAKIYTWFRRYGLVTVFIPALSPIPLPMKVPVFCAGALKVRWPLFLSAIAAARLIRYLALAYLGMHFGLKTFAYIRTHWPFVLVIAAVMTAVTLWLLHILDKPEAVSPKPLTATEPSELF